MFTSNSDEWRTPIDLFNLLNDEFHFDLDLCADDYNHLCTYYYTKTNSCFNYFPGNRSIFCNPPYGRSIGKFIRHCYLLSQFNNVVMLLPARTDTSWFHDYIYGKCEIRFIRGRLKFSNSKNSAPFPSMICIYRKKL